MANTSTFAIVGSGWRADFFARLGRLLPEQLTLVGAVVRRPESVEPVSQRWGVTTYLTPAELIAKQRPDFVVTSVPRAINPELIETLVNANCAVLSETPPATDLNEMRKLWSAVGARRRVQVAEQYLQLPGHAARRNIVREGVIGTPTSVHVSSTHDYHAISMIRGFLGVNFEPARIAATRFRAPLVNPLLRDRWSDDDTPKVASTIVATLDFGESSGLYDFTDNQWHNQLRFRRILIRGSRGEIHDDTVVHLASSRTILKSPIVRSQLGYDLNLDGYDTEHLSFEGKVVWSNDFLGLRLMDEELAIATMMITTGAWARDEGEEPYPLAQACQDHMLALAMHRAADTGVSVTTDTELWAGGEPN